VNGILRNWECLCDIRPDCHHYFDASGTSNVMFDELAERSLTSPLAGTKHTYVRLAIIIHCKTKVLLTLLYFTSRTICSSLVGFSRGENKSHWTEKINKFKEVKRDSQKVFASTILFSSQQVILVSNARDEGKSRMLCRTYV